MSESVFTDSSHPLPKLSLVHSSENTSRNKLVIPVPDRCSITNLLPERLSDFEKCIVLLATNFES